MFKDAQSLTIGDVVMGYGTVTAVYRYSEFVDVRFTNDGVNGRECFLRDVMLTVFEMGNS